MSSVVLMYTDFEQQNEASAEFSQKRCMNLNGKSWGLASGSNFQVILQFVSFVLNVPSVMTYLSVSHAIRYCFEITKRARPGDMLEWDLHSFGTLIKLLFYLITLYNFQRQMPSL